MCAIDHVEVLVQKVQSYTKSTVSRATALDSWENDGCKTAYLGSKYSFIQMNNYVGINTNE